MVPIWTPSSAKHGISQADAAYAIQNQTFSIQLELKPGESAERGTIHLFIGPQHPGTKRELEVLARKPANDGAEWVIFHVMPLGSKYRAIREGYLSEQER